jgi:hypothetical protein
MPRMPMTDIHVGVSPLNLPASHADVALSCERRVDSLPAVDSTVGYIPPMRGRSLSGAVPHSSVLRMECNPGTEHEQSDAFNAVCIINGLIAR